MLGLALHHRSSNGPRRRATVVRMVALASAGTCALGGVLLLLT